MKVNIGPYLTYWGPFQLVDLFLKPFGVSEDRRYEIGKWLEDNWKLDRITQWFYDQRERKISIRIDPYDTWNMDSTLAMLVLPMLKQLKEEKHGSPYVEDEDVPENLRYKLSGSFCSKRNHDQGELFPFDDSTNLLSDEMFADRWAYVLDEMIWAFEQLQPDYNWDEQYWKELPKLDLSDNTEELVTLANGETLVAHPVKWKVAGECDWEARQAHQKRIDNGVRLFGRYYQALWD